MRKTVNLTALTLIGLTVAYFSLNSTGFLGLPSLPLHLTGYFLLAGAALINFHNTTKGHLEAIATAFIFGLLLELLQTQIPSRTFSIIDLAVNLTGASLILVETRFKTVHRFIELEDKIIEAALTKIGL